jgi:hypothetical protein
MTMIRGMDLSQMPLTEAPTQILAKLNALNARVH